MPQGVVLVAVSKTHPSSAIREVYDAGCRIFGENRPQEMCEKHLQLPDDIEWHMIGHLQTNKVKMIAPYVAMIHSVDSDRLLGIIDREAARNNRIINVLLEIHVAEEESKSGWDPDELRHYITEGTWRNYAHIKIRGLMTVATQTDNKNQIENEFRRVKGLFDELKIHFGAQFDTLSMGMTGDYTTAIACGTTMVRIGSRIFGQRNYSITNN